ncbi:WYL domain-containing protein [Paenibacillus arenilitoris]|uniref:WYL domain-containing protein n=1 Tax=Paenibacillus arenilitoris TaxID=2772299 RepID=A0A927CTR0_9BACL|nr:WYL domain-containing protein [Paenibacillus arenilitoris]MBD2872753.1 WYL domain-containing protein [Paenibacillus arenilitoris]
MNPFEKIFNYQILSRLEDSGTFMVTAHERSWLKTMLRHPAASEAFAPGTLARLAAMLEHDPALQTDGLLLHKAASKEKQVYHALLRPLRQAITGRSLVTLSYGIKNGRSYSEQTAFPYKLEYSMVKREWYLLWYHLRHRALMSTKLQKIAEARQAPCPEETYAKLLATVQSLMENRKRTADVIVVRQYNAELSRILYAFSCFEKEVRYDAERNEYTIRVSFQNDECEYLLSKARFLGKRVRLARGGHMQRRMLESATKALARYGET